jgi:hypothetical protein
MMAHIFIFIGHLPAESMRATVIAHARNGCGHNRNSVAVARPKTSASCDLFQKVLDNSFHVRADDKCGFAEISSEIDDDAAYMARKCRSAHRQIQLTIAREGVNGTAKIDDGIPEI